MSDVLLGPLVAFAREGFSSGWEDLQLIHITDVGRSQLLPTHLTNPPRLSSWDNHPLSSMISWLNSSLAPACGKMWTFPSAPDFWSHTSVFPSSQNQPWWLLRKLHGLMNKGLHLGLLWFISRSFLIQALMSPPGCNRSFPTNALQPCPA